MIMCSYVQPIPMPRSSHSNTFGQLCTDNLGMYIKRVGLSDISKWRGFHPHHCSYRWVLLPVHYTDVTFPPPTTNKHDEGNMRTYLPPQGFGFATRHQHFISPSAGSEPSRVCTFPALAANCHNDIASCSGPANLSYALISGCYWL